MALSKIVNRLLFVLALAACIFAWGRLVYAAASNPAPAQIVTYQPEGASAEGAYCLGELISSATSLWRFPCFSNNPANATPSDGMVIRYALANASNAANQSWTLDAVETASILFTFLPQPDGDSVLMGYRTGDSIYFVRLNADGSSETIDLPEGVDHTTMIGASWVGDSVELAYRIPSVEEIDITALLFGGGDEDGDEGGEGGEFGEEGESGEGEGQDAPPESDESAETPADEPTGTSPTAEPTAEEGEESEGATEAGETTEGGDGEEAESPEGEGGEGEDDGGFMLPPLPVPRAETKIAVLQPDNTWETRDVTDPGCAQFIMVCWPELAYHTGDNWKIVYFSHSAMIDNVTGMNVDILTGTEDQPAVPTDALPLSELDLCWDSSDFDNLLFAWVASPLDPSRGNLMERILCMPLYRLENGENEDDWTALPVPQSDDGISYILPTHRAYFFNGQHLELLPIAEPLRSFNPQIYIGDRWVSLEYRPTDAPRTEAVLSLTEGGTTLHPVIGSTRSDWISPRVPLAAPDGNGGLWLVNPQGDTAHVDAQLQRVDAPGLGDRLRAMISDNFDRYPAETVYSSDSQILKQIAVPWLLLGLPLIVIVAFFIWRSVKSPKPTFIDSRSLLVGSVIYLVSFAALIGWFLALTAYL